MSGAAFSRTPINITYEDLKKNNGPTRPITWIPGSLYVIDLCLNVLNAEHGRVLSCIEQLVNIQFRNSINWCRRKKVLMNDFVGNF